MSRVGLVLGGGGITGAAFHFGTLLAIQTATGWDPVAADVIVGTSSGAAVASVVRSGTHALDALVGDHAHTTELSKTLRKQLYRRAAPAGLVRWVRHGLLPGARKPGFSLALGSPAPYNAKGIEDWVSHRAGDLAESWPTLPTLIVAYDLEGRHRVVFGTEESPDVPLKTAVAASSAVPMLYQPVAIDGRLYVDGGMASGTSADMVLGSEEPLDLVLVVAPMASDDGRPDAFFYEELIDRVGREALDAELDHIRATWPDTDIVVVKPDADVLKAMRPNPMAAAAAVPTFLRTLRSLRFQLGHPATWAKLERHLLVPGYAVPG